MEKTIIEWLNQISIGELIGIVMLFLVVVFFVIRTFDLRAESQRLRDKVDEMIKLNTAMILGMHNSGMIEATFDESGMPTGWIATSGKLHMLSGETIDVTGNVSNELDDIRDELER
ncbi:MAG TPA: hypothetical protein DDW55_02180 [Gammaproteobacteria bacterium]|nr:hypothetical protein [Gammaproteobacteria bacterium]